MFEQLKDPVYVFITLVVIWTLLVWGNSGNNTPQTT